jgi:glycine cleavage system H protein
MNTKDKEIAKFRIIPKSQNKCIWMEVGIVSYKICDRNFECETCPLDEGLRGDKTIKNHPKQNKKNSINNSSHKIREIKRDPSLERLLKHKLTDNYFVYSGHTWIKVLNSKLVKIGIDDIIATTLGSIDEVILPLVGEKIQKDGNCGQIIQFEQVFSIVSPVSGKIINVNNDLIDFPNKLTLDPLHQGWMLDIEPDCLEDDLKYCRSGDTLYSWYLKEFKWLECNLNKSFQQENINLGMTLYDGGEISRNLRNYLPKEHYRRLIINLLGIPNSGT